MAEGGLPTVTIEAVAARSGISKPTLYRYWPMTDQSSGRAAKSLFTFLYHAIPDMGCFHLPFIAFKALSCV